MCTFLRLCVYVTNTLLLVLSVAGWVLCSQHRNAYSLTTHSQPFSVPMLMSCELHKYPPPQSRGICYALGNTGNLEGMGREKCPTSSWNKALVKTFSSLEGRLCYVDLSKLIHNDGRFLPCENTMRGIWSDLHCENMEGFLEVKIHKSLGLP